MQGLTADPISLLFVSSRIEQKPVLDVFHTRYPSVLGLMLAETQLQADWAKLVILKTLLSTNRSNSRCLHQVVSRNSADVERKSPSHGLERRGSCQVDYAIADWTMTQQRKSAAPYSCDVYRSFATCIPLNHTASHRTVDSCQNVDFSKPISSRWCTEDHPMDSLLAYALELATWLST